MNDTVHLRAGALSLELAPRVGGSVAAFRLATEAGAFDLMRPMSIPQGASAHALHSSMFPMVPFANCLRDNRFSIDGRDYEVSPNMPGVRLNYHGSGWQLPWRVVTATADSVELMLEDTGVDGAHQFKAVQRFSLEPVGLCVETELTNQGGLPMPFSFGQHPWFMRHEQALVRFDATGLWLENADGHAERLAPVTKDADYSRGRAPPRSHINTCFAGWTGQAEVVWPRAEISLRIAADSMFGHLMFHVPHHDPDVFCLEPQTNALCAFDGLDAGAVALGVHVLAPRKSVGGTIRFLVRHAADEGP